MNQVAIVTGGSSGIGKATACMLSKAGYRVYELSRREGQPQEGIIHITADVTDRTAVFRAVEQVLAAESRIDLLVNNAGCGISGAVECADPDDVRRQFEVCFFGVLNCIQTVLPTMRAQRSGHIINVSSVAAPIAIPFQAFYSSVKAAINSLTFALRNEVKPFAIKVCAVQPGDVQTGFTDNRKKSNSGKEIYGDSLMSAVRVMEQDERRGMQPETVAKTILRAASSRNPRALYTVGIQYKLFALIAKFFPATLVNYLVGKIYS